MIVSLSFQGKWCSQNSLPSNLQNRSWWISLQYVRKKNISISTVEITSILEKKIQSSGDGWGENFQSILWGPLFSQPVLVNWMLSSLSGSINYQMRCWTLICIFAPDNVWQTNYFWRTPLPLRVWQFTKWNKDIFVTRVDPQS